MSEQKRSFMEQLDQWSDANVIKPLRSGIADGEVKYAIRQKVLESYKNGCKAGAGHVRSEYQSASRPASNSQAMQS